MLYFNSPYKTTFMLCMFFCCTIIPAVDLAKNDEEFNMHSLHDGDMLMLTTQLFQFLCFCSCNWLFFTIYFLCLLSLFESKVYELLWDQIVVWKIVFISSFYTSSALINFRQNYQPESIYIYLVNLLILS